MHMKKMFRKTKRGLPGETGRNRWWYLAGLLALAVLVCTVSALTIPAITMENTEYHVENGALLPAEGEMPGDSAPEDPQAESTAEPEDTTEPEDTAEPGSSTESEDAAATAAAMQEPDAAAMNPEDVPREESDAGDGGNLDIAGDPAPETVPASIQAPGSRSGTIYSSDLADFITEVVIRDADDNVVPPDGTVYLGESYSISIQFSEDNISGQEKQFVYNAEGYLTYQIPAFFVCAPIPDGTLTDNHGDIVGSYSIDSSGMLRIRFVEGFIDSTKASVNITLNSTASGSLSPGVQPIDFGGYIIEVNVSGAGKLNVKKTAGLYDARTHSIAYEVEVTAQRGSVSNITCVDTPTSSGLTIDPASVEYLSLDGLTVYPGQPTDLASGEGFLVRYRAILDPDIYQGKNHVGYTARNTAEASGVTDEGPVSASDSAELRVSTYFLRKTGRDEPSNGRIRWTVTVGDGSTVVDGLTLTDLPGAGLGFALAEGIAVTPWTYTAAGELVEGTAFQMSFGPDPTQITLPTGPGAYQYVLSYYTTYTMDPGALTQEFANTVSASDPAHDPVTVTGTATGHAIGAPPDIRKDVQKNPAGTALHYTVSMDVPGFYGGTAGFYFTDSHSKVKYGGAEYFFGQDIENLSVYTVSSTDAVRMYAPYTADPAAYTYRYRAADDPRTFYLYFNTATTSTGSSNWIETDDVTLYVEYDLPLDTPVYTRPDGVHYVPCGMTLPELIELESAVENSGRLYYNDRLFYVEDNASYREISTEPFWKRGKINDAGIIEYEFIFNNRDAALNPVLQRKMKELIFYDQLQTGGMRYVDGSLFCDIYNSSLSRIRTTYQYTPSISGDTALAASARDFTWYSGEKPEYGTLWEYAQHSTIVDTPRLVFRYQVQVDRTDPVFATSDLTVPLHNTAHLGGVMPDDTAYDTGPADCTVHYDTEILKKEVEHTAGSNRADFTITLNPMGIDLLDGVSQMTVLDKMTANLQPVLRSIRVFYKLEGTWTEATPEYTYDPALNWLTFTLPDNIPIRITYTTLITETGENVEIGNSIELEGYAEYSTVVDTEFKVDDVGGAAHADNFKLTLLKQAADTLRPLPGAVFALYGPPHSERQSVPPAGTPETVTVEGQTLRYYTSYTTGADGTVDIETNAGGVAMFSVQGLYALREITAPEGYHLLSDPICFYADERPAGGLTTVPVLASESPVVAADAPVQFQLPDTGGRGGEWLRILGILLAAAGMLCLYRRKKAAG